MERSISAGILEKAVPSRMRNPQLGDLVEHRVHASLGGVGDGGVLLRLRAEVGQDGTDGVLAVLGLDPAQAALGMSMTSSVTSSPRVAGRQCMNLEFGPAKSIISMVTWYLG